MFRFVTSLTIATICLFNLGYASPGDTVDCNDYTLMSEGISYTEYPASRHHALERIYGPYEVPLDNGEIRFLPVGFYLVIEDGSIWRLNDSQASAAGDWLSTDPLLIQPNSTWFSTLYPYKFVNLVTQAVVEVSLVVPPCYRGPFARWIHAINYGAMEIYLQDGSHWFISGLDSAEFSRWHEDDSVIIGSNDGWLSFRNPNILINASLPKSSHVRAVCK